MSEPAPELQAEPTAPRSRARKALLRRLADVVSLPASRVNAFERSVVGDLMVEILRDADLNERLRVARRVAPLGEIPNSLVRLFLRDRIEVASVLIDDCASLTDADLLACARDATAEHRLLIAARRNLSEAAAEAVAEFGEPAVLDALLKNPSARLSQPTIETAVAQSRGSPRLIEPLLRRPELRPSGAYVMFWWCDADARRTILQRFAVSREVMQEAMDEVFAFAAEEKWSDALSRKALQFIERRQRNRAAVEKSPFDSLEAAVDAAAEGLTRHTAEEIGYLAGIKPTTAAKILADPGGEPIAVLCKATGLPKASLRKMWRSMRRPETGPDGEPSPDLERVMVTYDLMAADRAQTVLRYWNWALSSALTPALVRAIRDDDPEALDAFSVPQRAAMLALGDDFKR